MKSTLEEIKARKHWIDRMLVKMELDFVEMFGPGGQRQFLTDLILIAAIFLDEMEEE